MNPRVKLIFEEHDSWLKSGGDHGIPGVQRANLAQVIDKHLRQESYAAQRVQMMMLHAIAKKAKLDDQFVRLIESLAPTGALNGPHPSDEGLVLGSVASSPDAFVPGKVPPEGEANVEQPLSEHYHRNEE